MDKKSSHFENPFTRYTKADISVNDTIVNDWDFDTATNNSSLNEDKSEMKNHMVNNLAITVISVILALAMFLTFLDYMCQRYRTRRNVDRIGRLHRMRNIDERRPPVTTAMMINPEGNDDRPSPQNNSADLTPEEEPQDESEIEDVKPITEHASSDDADKTGSTATLYETPVEGENSKEKVDETEMKYIDDEESENETDWLVIIEKMEEEKY